VVALCAALGFGVAAILANSLAIDLLLVLLATAIIVARRVAIPILAGAFLVSIVASAVLGATYTPGDRSGMIDRVVGSTLSERRPALWHDAIALIVESPVTGVGPGRFAAESPIARSDLDARWAHNEFLQFGAEVGVVGLIVLLLVFVWAFVRLQLESASDIVRILAAASLAAVGIHATVDYVLHFPLLVIAAASLLAVGLSTPALPRE
jgi:O-antigen ligase